MNTLTRVAFLRFAVVLLALLSLPILLHAQSSNGTLVGTVTDASGSTVPSADVKAVSPEFGEVHTTKTDSVGTYRLENLQPGTYGVTFTATGFAELQVSNVILRGSVTTTIDGRLEVGQMQKTVVVEASAAQAIDTQSGQLGESLGTQEIESLPYTSFNPAELAMTLPGVQDPPGNANFTNGIGFSVNGTRPRANNFLIDGQDDNDYSISGQAYQPTNLGAIQEFTVLTNSYGAEYGRGGGSVSNYIYKSGTNTWHGQAWEVNQNSAFATIPSQNKFVGQTTNPRFNENTFGFDVGGPVVKDKLFVFGTIQWDPTAQLANGSTLTLPTAFGVSTLQTLLPNPNVSLLLSALGGLTAPQNADGTGAVTGLQNNAPNCIALGSGRPCVQSGFFQRSNVSEQGHDTNYNIRLDYHTSPNDVLTASFIRSTNFLSPDFFNNAFTLPQFDTGQSGTTNVFRGGWTHTFSSTMVNEFRFSYTNIGFTFIPLPASVAGPLGDIPAISFGPDSNYPGFGNVTGEPQGRAHNIEQAQDAMSISHGRHTIKVGADITFLAVTDQIPFNNRGSLEYAAGGGFTSLGNFVDDFSGGTPGTISRQFGNPTITPNATIYAPYVQDTFRLKDNLTLTAGLRYEYWGTVGNAVQFPALDSRIAVFGIPGATFPGSFGFKQQPATHNFGPRLGFAYTPKWGRRIFGDQKTVLRGGYGIFYDGMFTNIVDNTAAASPNASAPTIFGGNSAFRGQANAMAAFAALSASPSPFNVIQTIPSNLKNPLTQQFNLDVQRELPGKFIVTASYVGTYSQRLFTNQDLNAGIGFDNAGNAIHANPNFSEVEIRGNQGVSTYNAAQFEVERRVNTSLTIRGSYTFAKFLDDASEVFVNSTSGLTSFAQDPQNQLGDYGPSIFDRRHRGVIAYVWSMPYSKSNWLMRALTDRWQWSGIASFDSGSPDTPFDGFDIAGTTHPSARPNVSNPNQPLTATGIDGSQLGLSAPGTFFPLNTCFFGNPGPCTAQPASAFRFIIPASGFGNAGRNSVYGPGQWYFDTSIQRTFPIPIGRLEHQSITFRTEFFNAFNHANLFTPSYNLLDQNYDNLAATTNGGRTIKFWLRYDF
jgi:Carboxypeptidase regulatory-like domain/TonB-dependent Receptor Plug Domain/TonB dependent receptor